MNEFKGKRDHCGLKKEPWKGTCDRAVKQVKENGWGRGRILQGMHKGRKARS